MNPPEYTNIRDLKASMKNLTMMFIVLEMGRPNVTKKGNEVRTCKIADKTGSINISLWDEIGKVLQPGDICKLVKGYTSLWKGCLTLYTGEKGEVTKVGEFCMVFSETPNMSEAVTESQSSLKPDSRSSSPTSQMTSGSHSTPSSSGQSTDNSRGPSPSIGGNGHYAIQGFPSSGGLPFQRNSHTPRPRSGSDASSTRVSLLNHNNGNSNNGTSNGSNNGPNASNTHNSNTSNNNRRRK